MFSDAVRAVLLAADPRQTDDGRDRSNEKGDLHAASIGPPGWERKLGRAGLGLPLELFDSPQELADHLR